MSLLPLIANGVWAALLSGAFVVLFSAPLEVLPLAAGAGFLARVLRDVLLSIGATQALATFCAAVAAVVIASALMRRRHSGVSQVVLLSGLLPLGAAKSVFEAITGLIKAPTLSGEALAASSGELMSDLAVVITMTMALALGAAIGALIVGSVSSVLESEETRGGA